MAKREVCSLPIEDYPSDYTGYEFITLIGYQDKHWLTIIDNYTNHIISAYVLELCGPESVEEATIIEHAIDWFAHHRHKIPLSIYFNQKNMQDQTARIFKTIPIEYVTRLIGPLPIYTTEYITVRRRRKK